MEMTTLQKVTFCLLFLPGYILVWLGSFKRTKGEIRKAQRQYKQIHFYGPLYAMITYLVMTVILLLLLSSPTDTPAVPPTDTPVVETT